MLIRSVTEHDWRRPPDGIEDLLAGQPLDELPPRAAHHGVSGFVHHSLRGLSSLPEPTRARLEADYHRGLRTHVAALADLGRLAPVLDALGAPWLVVKGPVLSTGLYARPDLRAYNDLDVLVPGRALAAVVGELRGLGCQLANDEWLVRPDGTPGEIDLRLPFGTMLDLHWHLLNDPVLRRTFDVRMGELFERARTVEVQGIRLHTLDAVDTVLHLGLHGCLSGGNRLIWTKDVERALAGLAPSWDVVVERCRRRGIGLPVANVLDQARDLGADVPAEVLDALAPSPAWRALNRLARRLSPPEQSRGQPSPARLLAVCARRDPARSIAEVGRHVAEGVSRRVPLRGRRNAERRQGVPGEAELAEFVRAVALEDGGARP